MILLTLQALSVSTFLGSGGWIRRGRGGIDKPAKGSIIRLQHVK